MDAVEGLKLLDGSFASWLRISDEFSGAILATYLFAVQRWSSVPTVQTQNSLQEAFAQWGRPGTVRVDNGIPWANRGGLPCALSLWLAGLDVRMRWNDPYRPEQNGVVENTQGVSQRWAAPPQCANFEDLCQRVQCEDRVQRNEYPAIEGWSRREAYPWLCHSGRAYVKGCGKSFGSALPPSRKRQTPLLPLAAWRGAPGTLAGPMSRAVRSGCGSWLNRCNSWQKRRCDEKSANEVRCRRIIG